MERILQQALTFDDVLLVPGHSTVLPRDTDLTTPLSRGIKLNIPLLSSAMDTVTESRQAIAMAQEGGLGIIHKNMGPDEQAAEVRRVKKYESGIISDPITVSPGQTVREVLEITRAHGISGLPVVDGRQLVGIVTNRDVRFETALDAAVSTVMTGRDRLVTVAEGTDRDQVLALMQQHRIEKILVINDTFQLRGMITVKDIQKSSDYPNACKDTRGSLRVGAAVGTGAETDERVAALIQAGADVIVVDTAHGHSQGVLDRVRWVKQHYPDMQVIGGNIATAEAALALVEAGADAVKVGIGPGSICTTRIITGVGVPQFSAIRNVAQALHNTDVPLIADGGIRFSGDMAKAIAAGAHSVMLGSMFAGTEEAPGEVMYYKGRTYKSYRGMGSLGAMSGQNGSSDRYFQDNAEVEKMVPEGIEGRVPFKGSVVPIIQQMVGGLRSSMGYTGCRDLSEMRNKPRFVQVSSAGMSESHVHDVTITKQAPNYRID